MWTFIISFLSSSNMCSIIGFYFGEKGFRGCSETVPEYHVFGMPSQRPHTSFGFNLFQKLFPH